MPDIWKELNKILVILNKEEKMVYKTSRKQGMELKQCITFRGTVTKE